MNTHNAERRIARDAKHFFQERHRKPKQGEYGSLAETVAAMKHIFKAASQKVQKIKKARVN